MQSTQRWFRRLRQLCVVTGLLLLAVLWSVVAYEFNEVRVQQENALGVRAETMAKVYGEVVRGRIQELDTAMLLLRDKAFRQNAADFAHLVSVLERGPLAGLVAQVSVIGADGVLKYSNLGMPTHLVNLSDRAHFQVHQGDVADRLFIGPPVLGRVSREWTVQVSRRIHGADGGFDGVLVMSVLPKALAQTGRSLELGPDHVLTLVRSDLTVLSRYPQVNAYLGTRLSDEAAAYLKPPYQAHRRASVLDDHERMIAYHPLPELEMLAGVSLSVEAMETEVAQERRMWLGMGVLGSVLLLAGLVGALRYFKEKETAELRWRKARLRQERDLALARLGSWELDLRGGAGYWSDSAYEIFGFPRSSEPPALEQFMERLHPDCRAHFKQALRQCESLDAQMEVECRIQDLHGRERVLFVRGNREMDGAGVPLRIAGVVMDVTESRRLESSLRLAEQRWQWAVTASRDGVWDVQPQARKAWYSPRWKAILGFEPDELPDDYDIWKPLVHPDDLARVEQALQDYIEGRLPFYEAEYRMRTKHGEWRWILSRGQVVEWGAEHEPMRLLGTHSDITERKAAELDLLRERERLEEAQTVAQMGSWEWDIASGVLWWSAETYRIFGLPRTNVPPSYETFLGCVHPDDRHHLQAAVNAAMQEGMPYQIEHRVVRPDGSERVVQERGRLERDEQGGVLHMVGTALDITARQQAESAMVESEARYRSLVTAMAEGVLVQGQQGEITFCNDSACETLGVSREQLLGMDAHEPLWHATGEDGHTLAPEQQPCVSVLESGRPVDRMVIGVTRPDGQRIWLTLNARPLMREGETRPYGVVTTFADITWAKLAQLNAQLAEAVVNSTNQPIVVTDAEGFIVQANPAFCQLVGYGLTDIVGRPVGGVMHSGQHDPDFYQHLWQQLHKEGNWEGEVWNRCRTGEVLPQWLAITAIRDPSGRVERYVGIYMDITEHKRREERMWRAANYDPLTGQPNRLLFQDRLQAGLARARRLGTRLAVLFIDLDHFKDINDSHGHQAGDTVLQTVARRMADCVREDDTVARIAGDEFMGLLQNIGSDEEVAQVAGKLLEAVLQPIPLGHEAVQVSCSIGYAIFPDDDPEGTALGEKADQAMYGIKASGRRGVAHYQQQEGAS